MAKNCLKNKQGKGSQKQVNKAKGNNEWYYECDWQDEWCECDGDDEESNAEKHVTNAEDHDANQAKKGKGKGKGKKGKSKKGDKGKVTIKEKMVRTYVGFVVKMITGQLIAPR